MTVERDHLSKAESVTVAAIEGRVPLLVQARDIVASFQRMVRTKSVAELDVWLERAKSSLVASFTNGIVKDKAAVSAAINAVSCPGRGGRRPWNGPPERTTKEWR